MRGELIFARSPCHLGGGFVYVVSKMFVLLEPYGHGCVHLNALTIDEPNQIPKAGR